MENKDIVLLSTAEWDNPFWTNKQHVAVALAKMGHKVYYIDSLGLRKPSVTSQDLRRILKSIKRAFRAPQKVQPNIWVWSPIIIPFQSNSCVQLLNKLVIELWLSFWLKKLNFKKDLFWTYNPLTCRIFNIGSFKKIVYHCVDEIKAQPGMPVTIIEENEYNLVKQADVIFTTSKQLYESRKKWNENIFYFSNVADFNHFQKAMLEETIIPDDIKNIPPPRIGFVGALSGYKVDFELIQYIATKNPDYSFVLIGKVGEGDPWTDISMLKKIKNIYILGSKDYQLLPNYLKAIDVAMLPNNVNEYTDSMFPMKFFEYLAAAKPIVSVNLKSLIDYQNVLYMSKDYEEFNRNIRLAVENTNYNLSHRLELASMYTYDSRMQKMMQIVNLSTNL